MKKENIFKSLEKVLKTKEKYFDKEQEVILRNTISEDAENFDAELLGLLLSDEKLKEHFFVKVGKAVVFDKDKFLTFVNNKKFLPDSYTKFTQNIGLTEDDEFLKSSGKVVLNWPYKDCVLEGGQTKEDQKRNEIFFNEILEKDEIDVLLKPKAFTKFKKYSRSKGKIKAENIEEFKRGENGVIKDNLIIKGNNLLALHSLKEEFAGKVKLIYIDPPYNTGNDGFKYNDNFNHSTWLTFMKNRLEVARDLLGDDGSIFISIDDNEFAYLKILCDEIFGKNNFLSDIIWNSTKSVTNTAIISTSHTHNLVYFKNKNYYINNRTEFRLAENGEGFSNPDNDSRGVWKADPFQVGGWRPNQQYKITNPNTGKSYKPNKGCSWKNDFNKFKKLLKDNRIVFGVDGKAGPQRKRFLFEAKDRGKVAKTIWDNVGTTANGTQHLNNLLERNLFSNPKPESFLKKIFELATKENDIVLDFFAGSGTTGAVAHKMNRQYILIEQMDYIKDLPEARIKKVIEGEQGGISKSVNWKGGGEFIYMEMKEFNQEFLDQVKEAKSKTKLKKIFKAMKEKAFLSYRFSEKEFENKIDEFNNLSLEDQKLVLDELLDKNQMYLPHTEIRDITYKVSKKDIEINKSFYGK